MNIKHVLKIIQSFFKTDDKDAYQTASPELKREAETFVLGFPQTNETHMAYISPQEYYSLVAYCYDKLHGEIK